MTEPQESESIIAGEPPVEEPVEAVPSEAAVVVQNPAGWSLVQAGGWEVSIGPDGMIMLPRHLSPEEVPDFVAAIAAAAAVGAENKAVVNAADAPPALDSTLVVQASGEPLPPGAVQLQPASGAGVASGSTVTRLDLADPTASDRPATPVRPPATETGESS